MRQSLRRPADVRIGISGWTYPGWRGVFYPPGLPHRRELEYASRAFDAVEVNGTFYCLQRRDAFESWYRESPPGFVFSLKAPRFITHMLKLKGAEQALANFFASGPLALREKLGPILWQLPHMVRFDPARLEGFLSALPRTTALAARIAKGHDHRVKGAPLTDAFEDRPLRHALEVRSPTFLVPEALALLRRHGVALVFADSAGLWPYAEDVTGDFVYVRLHGATELYASGYTDAQLDWWAARLAAWSRGGEPPDAVLADPASPCPRRTRDAYVFFDNDAKVQAPFDARRLAERVAALTRPSGAAASPVPAAPPARPGSRSRRAAPSTRTGSRRPS